MLVPGANGEERYVGTLPLALFALSLNNSHNFKMDAEHLGVQGLNIHLKHL